ncbi:hypothetical protein H6G06_21785 [Anabaena sphaerica FACHB-251]|uniref:Uncharacterized protein n=1 Tax=Anabaena sphaerica FACHB-251 TaxID=2692883 RepID=A0A926WK17_9NOST|nr:hypothetical protein [Anabaena sphaerica FACHB-251]
MTQIQLTLVISYLLMACYFFTNWLRFSLRHPAYTPEEKFLSFVMSLITTIFWPLILPLSCLKIVRNRKLKVSKVIPVLLGMFVFSICYYVIYVHGHLLCSYDLFCPYAS